MGLGTIIAVAIGGALAFEGVIWAIFPSQTRRMYQEALSQMDDKALHIGGLISVLLGVLLVGTAVKLGG
ncbi:DUF2065 domain-containing protein [Hellea sp.]|nr:DUF2065 domain-containing protein [Hellea sp.]MDB2437107.1 DUF2065 domain-containing protein [Hellea sp.]